MEQINIPLPVQLPLPINVGDKFWAINERHFRNDCTCPHCKGDYLKVIDGIEYYCGKCYKGQTPNKTYNTKYVVEESVVTKISLLIKMCTAYIEVYHLNYVFDEDKINLKDIYMTEQDALDECERLNKALQENNKI